MIRTERPHETTLRFLAEPSDVNFGGKVHGGAVMKWIDQAGYACAVGWSGHYCVTLYVGGLRFYKPILIGNMVEVRARVIYTGNTSIRIAVDVSAGDPRLSDSQATTHCVIVFVAVDEQGKPVPVTPWPVPRFVDFVSVVLRPSALTLRVAFTVAENVVVEV